jgi:hypothetical protein
MDHLKFLNVYECFISCMHATCPANVILLYYIILKYLGRSLNYEASDYENVSIFLTFSSLRFPLLKHPPMYVLHIQSRMEYTKHEASCLVGHIRIDIMIVVERRSTLAEFRTLDIVELVRCS